MKLIGMRHNPKYIGAQLGFMVLLHTWGQNLMFHPHLHCIVTSGGLSLDGIRWINSRKKFFIPVKVLSIVFKSAAYVLQYLGRYTHRVAISNNRIEHIENSLVTFKWKDYKDKSKRLAGAKIGDSLRSSKKPSTEELLLKLTGVDIRLCPCCKKGKMTRKSKLWGGGSYS